jgi:hypothetical protein
MSNRNERAANRRNTETTGTPQGQPASRYNAANHGIVAVHQIMFDETAGDLTDLAAEYHHQYSPADSTQRFLVDALIANEWRLRRLRRVEAELWEHATNIFMAANLEAPACSSGDAFATASPTFERLQRIENSCERAYHRALKELQAKVGQALPPANPDPQSQQAAPAAAAPPQPQQSKPTSAKLGSFRQNPQTASRAAAQPPPATPFAAPPSPAEPSESQPSATDRHPKPQEAV